MQRHQAFRAFATVQKVPDHDDRVLRKRSTADVLLIPHRNPAKAYQSTQNSFRNKALTLRLFAIELLRLQSNRGLGGQHQKRGCVRKPSRERRESSLRQCRGV